MDGKRENEDNSRNIYRLFEFVFSFVFHQVSIQRDTPAGSIRV